MNRILIRCDASEKIGSGHVIRCLTLAKELRNRGADVIFVSRKHAGNLNKLIEDNFQLIELERRTTNTQKDSNKLYLSWLQCSESEDAEDTQIAVEKRNICDISMIIVDHYALGTEWESKIRANINKLAEPVIMVIDDLANRKHDADILLDQNFFGNSTRSRYKSLTSYNCKIYLGPKFSILSEEYAIMHKIIPSRTSISRILVYFGGVDPQNYTSSVIKKIMQVNISGIHIDVVVGLQCKHIRTIEELSKRTDNINIYRYQPSLAGLIARADLAIGAGGTTTWERCCLGLPSITFITAENQFETNNHISKAMNCEWMCIRERPDSVDFKKIFSKLMDETYFSMVSKKILNLTNGYGTKLIADVIFSKLQDGTE